jgi:hypothetical protein
LGRVKQEQAGVLILKLKKAAAIGWGILADMEHHCLAPPYRTSDLA